MIQRGRLLLVVAVLLPALLIAVVERASEVHSTAAAPAAPTLLSPIGGVTLTSFGAALQWTNPSGATQIHIQVIPYHNDGPSVDVHLDTGRESFWVPSPPDWYGLLPDMTYTWRVQVSDAARFVSLGDASWSPWAEAHFRTPNASSFLISAISPAQNAVVDTLVPTLRWSNGQYGVFYYELQLSKDQTFNTDPATATAIVYWMLIHGGVTQPSNSYTVPEGFYIERGTRYYWRVRPRVQGNGTAVTWSQTFVFNTAADARVLFPTPTPTATVTATPTPVATPAGTPSRIAFTSNRDDNEEIYVMNADGGGLTNLTSNPAEDMEPVWLPDGAKMAFTSKRDGNRELYLMSADGSSLANLTSTSANEGQPAWAVQVPRMAFVSDSEGKKKVYIADRDGRFAARLNTSGSLEETYPAWFLGSGQTDMIAYLASSGDGEASIVVRPLLDPRSPLFLSPAVEGRRPAVSPDGAEIAFVSARGGNREIYTVATDGWNKAVRLTNHFATDDRPAWSPDGKKILFESERDGNFEIYVMNADGTGLRNLTNNPAPDYKPVWSPDGTKIAFVSVRDGNAEIYVMNADGSSQTNLTNHPALDTDPVWSPR